MSRQDSKTYPSTFIVIPVYNRRETTLKCLTQLQQLDLPAQFAILVVDDGSDDGTAEQIANLFPSVRLVRVNGGLWWTGAISLGTKLAYDEGGAAFVWLNDDCLPTNGCLELLVNRAMSDKCITVAQPETSAGMVYGGYLKTLLGLRRVACGPDEERECDAANGNCVCIPRSIVELIGFPDANAFPQNHGDTDYTLRATEAGRRCLIVGKARCYNSFESTTHNQSWLLGESSLRSVLATFQSPKSGLYFPAWARLCLKHWGVLGMLSLVLPYFKFAALAILRLSLPQSWLVRWRGSSSIAWQMRSNHGNLRD